MPFLLPLAAVITTALAVKTINGTIKKVERKKRRKSNRLIINKVIINKNCITIYSNKKKVLE